MRFADDPDQVRLADFRFRTGARFVYAYNFPVPWRHAIRVEQILSPTPGHRYPVCIGGARAAPPESWRSPRAFLALRQQYHPLHVIERLLALLDHPDDHDDPYDELRELRYWAVVNRCDRRTINQQLRRDQALTPESELR